MEEVKSYALVKDGFVVNCVQWDGVGDIFSQYITFENTDNSATIGDAFVNGELYTRPRDGYEYNFDAATNTWSLTSESAAAKTKDTAAARLTKAESEYTRATEQINALTEQIEDEDYGSGETEQSVTSDKEIWTAYRKELRAYIRAASGSEQLPDSPDKISD